MLDAVTLAKVLAPLDIRQFLTTYVGRHYLLAKGTAGRFRALATWPELNTVLSQLRGNDERVKLVKNGKGVPTSAYVHASPSGRIYYVIGSAIRRHVLGGASLVLNQVDELLPEVRRLVESCEDVFDVHVAANLYAGWRTDNAFDVHWDRHDTLVIQILGRKNWKVWQPTTLHPLPDQARPDAVPVPTGEPIWQGQLEDGSILYMPRGWWHVASPCDEPSVHVTIGIKHLTGADLLGWAVERLKEFVDVRRDVPRWQAREDQVAWLRSLRAVVNEALHDDALDRYVESVADTAPARSVVRLPQTSQALELDNGARLRLSNCRKLRFHGGGSGMLTFRASGREWKCQERLRPALELLSAVEPCTLADMRAAIPSSLVPLVHPFLSALIAADVVWIEAQKSEPQNASHDAVTLTRAP